MVDIPAVQDKSVSQLGDALPDYGLLVLVDQYDLDEMVTLLGAGATGFIKRDASVGDLARAIIASVLAYIKSTWPEDIRRIQWEMSAR